jgi:hypothetical protein
MKDPGSHREAPSKDALTVSVSQMACPFSIDIYFDIYFVFRPGIDRLWQVL